MGLFSGRLQQVGDLYVPTSGGELWSLTDRSYLLAEAIFNDPGLIAQFDIRSSEERFGKATDRALTAIASEARLNILPGRKNTLQVVQKISTLKLDPFCIRLFHALADSVLSGRAFFQSRVPCAAGLESNVRISRVPSTATGGFFASKLPCGPCPVSSLRVYRPCR
jgi:hypothetical protein